jgi:septal ring factor EnvC (AmiA/AmiB activator)
MLRRANKSDTAHDHSKEQLAREESALRDQMEKLERMIAEAPRVAEEEMRKQREELRARAGMEQSRLDVSLGATDKWMSDGGGMAPRRGSMRKQRREGRIIFLVLLIALAGLVLWLLSHLQVF